MDRDREKRTEMNGRPRRRSRRRTPGTGRNKRFLLLPVFALLFAVVLAAAFRTAENRRAAAGREEAGSVRPELMPGDDSGTGLGGKAREEDGTETETKAENGGQTGEPVRESAGESKDRPEEDGEGEENGGSQKGVRAFPGSPGSRAEKTARELLASMTLEEKILQLFMITPEALTGYDEVYAAGEATKEAVGRFPVGGIVYFSQNLRDEDQTKDMLARTARYSRERTGLPMLLAVDEEGGSVARLSGREGFSLPAFPDMSQIGASGDAEKAFEVGDAIGAYLRELGFNMDFAPVADVLTNPENTVVKRRSFGSDAKTAAGMVSKEVEGLESHGVSSVLKHFPGHGGTAEDSHDTAAVIHRTVDELLSEELIPFAAGIESGADFVMAGHISDPEAVGDDRPAVFSRTLLTEVLRETLGFDGIIITDAMNMGAVTERYESGEAAVKALLAGADMILMPEDFQAAYQGVMEAVEDGTLTERRIEESVLRILTLKAQKSESGEAAENGEGRGEQEKEG